MDLKLKRQLHSCIFLLISVSSASALTTVQTDAITGSQLIRNIEPPRFLYHWTSFEALAKIAGEKRIDDTWDQFADYPTSGRPGGPTLFFSRWPQFAANTLGALFAWTHPVLGMKGGEFENYGNVLVQIEIDPQKTRAAKVISNYNLSDGSPSYKTDLDISDINLVDHGFEWVILDPKIIKNFTADVGVLKPLLERELELLRDPSHQYDSKDIHYVDFKEGGYVDSAYLKYAIGVIGDLIQTNRDAIPSWFRRDTQGRAIQANWVTGPEALVTTIPLERNRRANRGAPLMDVGYIKNVKVALSKIDVNARCDATCLSTELEWRLVVYSEFNPNTSNLRDIQHTLADVIAQFDTIKDTFLPTLIEVASHLRDNSFDPYRSILDLMFLVRADRYHVKYNKLLKQIQTSEDIDKFQDAYKAYWLNRGRRYLDERLQFLKQSHPNQFSNVRSNNQLRCQRLLGP